MKIIVRLPNWIGDTILALPVIDCLKQNFPQAHLWASGKEWAQDLLLPGGLVEAVSPVPNLNDVRNLWESSQRIKGISFDVGLLLTNSFSSAFHFYLAKIPERWGYATDGRAVLLTKSVSAKNKEENSHQLLYYMNLLRGLGLQTTKPELQLSLPEEEKEAGLKMLLSYGIDGNKKLVIVSPGAFYGPAKRWPPERFAALANLLQKEENAEILIIGAADEADIAISMSQAMEKQPIILSGKTTLRQLLGIISQASLFITNDTGPMHMANALKVPIVAIFGPTDPRITAPFSEPAAVIKKDVACWPCTYRICPYDHRCMMRIEPEEVFQISRNFLR